MKTALSLCFLLLSLASARPQQVYPFNDVNLPDEERLDDLLERMTLDEKVRALSTNVGVPRLGIRANAHVEGLHGLALGGPANWGGYVFVHGQRIPDTKPTTTFPQAYGLGSTWDTELISQVAEVTGNEMRYYYQRAVDPKGSLVLRAPNADLARDPRWGRTEESFGEDPYLVGAMTASFVKGLQGDHPRYWRAASLMKHFLANSNEDGRDSTSSDFRTALFDEYYAYPFRRGVEAGASSMMAAYNSWNGIPMTIHPVLWDIRRDWDMKGIICTDGGALKLLVESHKYTDSFPKAAADVVKAGVGQFLDTYVDYIYTALEQGLLTEAEIDKAIRGNFYTALKLGLLDNGHDNPYAGIGVTDTDRPWEDPEVREFVRLATAKSVVVLKNEKGLLPIDAGKVKKIAVIGPRAGDVLLDWYSGTPPYTVSVKEGFENAGAGNYEVIYEPSNSIDLAYNAAKEADVAVVCVGNHVYGTDPKWMYSPVPSDGREGIDRKALNLEQEDLVRVVYKANPNTVLVLISSFPYTINWSQENLPAIVHIANNSQELGNGLADVLLGKLNPAGRTVQTWVKSIADLPPMMDYDITNGRTYMYFTGEPLYPFGHGLSYTSFNYSNMRIADNRAKGVVGVSFEVTNSGNRDGEEVAQVYVARPGKGGPARQLKGFRRVAIPSGDKAVLQFEIPYTEFTKESIPSGTFEIMAGASSADIRLTKRFNIKR